MNWFNGDGTPEVEGSNSYVGGKLGEDPIKSAAKEMAATTAAYAMQKAQLVGSGLAGLAGGGVPSAASIANWQNTGTEPVVNPYAHLSRDEKLALISQLQKAKAEREAIANQPAEPELPSDMIDPLEALSKGGGVPGKVQKHTGPASEDSTHPETHNASDKTGVDVETADKEVVAKEGQGKDSKMEAPMKKSMNIALQAFTVANNEDALRKSYDILQKCMSGETSRFIGTPYEKAALDATIDYKKSVLAIRKEKMDANESSKRWEKMDKARNAYYDKLDELEVKTLEHKRKMMDLQKADSALVQKPFDDLLEKAANPFAVCHASTGPEKDSKFESCVQQVKKKEGIKKAAASTQPGRVPVERPGPTKELNPKDQGVLLSKSSEGEGSRGGKVIGHTSNGEVIYESKDKYGPEMAGHKAEAASAKTKGVKKQYSGRHGTAQGTMKPEHWNHANHKDAAHEHEKAALLHAHEAEKHEKGSFDHQRHSNSASFHQMRAKEHHIKAKMAHHIEQGEGDKAHEAAKEFHALPHGNPEEKKKVLAHGEKVAKKMKKSGSASDLADYIQKSESGPKDGEETMENASSILNDFLSKSEGQGGLPESGNPPSEMPTGRRAVDGESLDGKGAPSGSQSPPEASVASTAGAPSVPSEELDKKAGGEALSKGGNFIDWNQAADDGEHLRAQLVSQLLNKSLDVTVGIGVKAPIREAPVQTQRIPQVMLQKGGHTVYVDSEDEFIEKSMNRVSGTQFTQGSQANFGAPAQHEIQCGCGALTKSYLTSCTECGTPLHGSAAPVDQGLRLEKSVAASLVPGFEDEISIG